MVPGDADRARASGAGQASFAAGGIIGPPLAAPLLFAVGVRWALLLNALSFVVSFLAVRAVRAPATPEQLREAPGPEHRRVAGAPRGRRRDRAQPPAVSTLVKVVVAALGTGGLNALGAFFVVENVRADPQWYGTLGAAVGAGSVVGAMASGCLAARLGSARIFSLCALLVGALIVVYARLTDLWPAVVLLGALGLPLAALKTVFMPGDAARSTWAACCRSSTRCSSSLRWCRSRSPAGWRAPCCWGSTPRSAGCGSGRLDTIFLASGLLVLTAGVYAAVAMRGADRVADASPVGGLEASAAR